MRDPDLYDIARMVTDEVLGEGTYAELNRSNPDPGVRAAIKRSERPSMTEKPYYDKLIEAHAEHIGDNGCPDCPDFATTKHLIDVLWPVLYRSERIREEVTRQYTNLEKWLNDQGIEYPNPGDGYT